VNVYKIFAWIGVAIAILAAFVNIPFAGLALAICGVIVGIPIAAEHYVRVIVSAIALRMLADVFGGLPGAGGYVTAIIGNFATFAAGAALLIIFRNMWERWKP